MKCIAACILLAVLLLPAHHAFAQCVSADHITMRQRVVCNNGPGLTITIAVDLKKTTGTCIGGYRVHFRYDATKMTYLSTSPRYNTQYWTNYLDYEDTGYPFLPRVIQHEAPGPGNALPLDTTYFASTRNCNNVRLNDGYRELLYLTLTIKGSAQGTADFVFMDWLNYKSGGGAPGGTETFTWNTNLNDNYNETKIELTGIVVPVELVGFQAEALPTGDVRLHWRTVSETSNHGFDVERQIGEEWEKIGFVQGAGTTTRETEYSYLDSPREGARRIALQQGGVVNYRLRQIDTDGKSGYSQIASVELSPRIFELGQSYPNPFSQGSESGAVATIPYQLPVPGSVRLAVYNTLGERVALLVPNEMQGAGYHSISWNGRADNGSVVRTGTYLYRMTVTYPNGETVTSNKKCVVIR